MNINARLIIGVAIASECVSEIASALSSVTLYSIVDDGLVYTNNQSTLRSTSGGKSTTKLVSRLLYGSRFGF